MVIGFYIDCIPPPLPMFVFVMGSIVSSGSTTLYMQLVCRIVDIRRLNNHCYIACNRLHLVGNREIDHTHNCELAWTWECLEF